ncbi:MAG TPA: 50S ribosomal protein L17 [Thermoanaerobaculia bacterium]|jgi:large subunit ribosomal protein L17|nr:50S ribosomal protein L17 [Thermoanaerobaculia bacterium]
MMHNRAGRKLRRTTSHRLAMFSNQLASLMTHERIQTTLTKAKELRPLAERLITTAKNDGVAARRKVAQWIPDRTTVKKVFEKIAPRFVDRPGGYTRILRLGARRGDAAEAAILEFVDYRFEAREKAPRKESMADRARRATGGRVETVRKRRAEGEAEVEADSAEAKKQPKAKKPPRGGKAEAGKTARKGPSKGPSRTGHTKRGE